jgi:hypothetical protein
VDDHATRLGRRVELVGVGQEIRDPIAEILETGPFDG